MDKNFNRSNFNNMANQWFRFYGSEFLSDPKMDSLDGNERSIWLTVLCLASQDDGVIKYTTEEKIIEKSNIPQEHRIRYAGILKKLENLCMIQLCNGNVTLVNWQKRQYSEGYSRIKEFRKRKRNAKDNDRTEQNRTERKKEVVLPDWLNKEIWQEWAIYRKEKKKSLTPLTIKKQIAFLEVNKFDHKQIITNSIQNGWTGLFPLKNKPTSTHIPSIVSDYAVAHAKRIQAEEEKREFEANAKHNNELRKVEELKRGIVQKFKV